MVRERGLEPPPLAGPDPKSGVSAISPLAQPVTRMPVPRPRLKPVLACHIGRLFMQFLHEQGIAKSAQGNVAARAAGGRGGLRTDLLPGVQGDFRSAQFPAGHSVGGNGDAQDKSRMTAECS